MTNNSPEASRNQALPESGRIDYRGLYVDAQLNIGPVDADGRNAGARKIVEASHAAALASSDSEVQASASTAAALEDLANSDIGPHPWPGHEYRKKIKNEHTKRAMQAASEKLIHAENYRKSADKVAADAFEDELRLQDEYDTRETNLGLIERVRQYWVQRVSKSKRD